MFRKLASATLFCAMMASGYGEEVYHTGGSRPLSPAIQQELDERAGLIRLGLNVDEYDKVDISPEFIAKAAISMSEAVERNSMPGGVLYVDRFAGENMPIAVGYRMVDPEPWQAEWDTLYELGDLSGPIMTTTIALHMLDEGSLKLTDTVGQYIPILRRTSKGAITVEQLLRHSSGLPANPNWPKDLSTRGQLMTYIAQLPLTHEPGGKVVRGSLNLLLLGVIIELRSGLPIQELAQKELFQPLGMVGTATPLPDQWRAGAAPGPYTEWLGRLAWGEAADPSAYLMGTSAAHGGVYSRADDLAIFARTMLAAHAARDFITTSTLTVSLTPDPSLAGGENQGLGWALNGMGEGSFGWDAENGCSLWIMPKERAFFIFLSNMNHPYERNKDHGDCRQRVQKIVLKAMEPRGPDG